MKTIIGSIATIIVIVTIILPTFSDIGGSEVCDNPLSGWKQACDAAKKKLHDNIKNNSYFRWHSILSNCFFAIEKSAIVSC